MRRSRRLLRRRRRRSELAWRLGGRRLPSTGVGWDTLVAVDDTRVAPRGSRDPILAGGGGGATAHARDANRNRKRIAGGRAGPRERALVYNLSLLL